MANLNISNIPAMIKEVKETLTINLDKAGIDFNEAVFLNSYSAGKDSQATRHVMNEITEGHSRSVMADTDNENPITLEYAKSIHEQDGYSPVEIIRADFSEERFAIKRDSLSKRWSKHQRIQAGAYKGVTMPRLNDPDSKFSELWRKYTNLNWQPHDFQTPLEAALHYTHRTGNAFLDSMILHGKQPQRKDRSCTEELKMDSVWEQVNEPLIEDGEFVIQASGVRSQESEKRAAYKRFEEDRRDETQSTYNFLPIQHWLHQDVFACMKYFGVNPNPLYKMGMGRVGCMPCILVNKDELVEIAARFPEEIDRIYQWELHLRWVSRWLHWRAVPSFNQKEIYKVHKGRILAKTGKKHISMGPHKLFGMEVCHRGLTHEPFALSNISFLGDRGGKSNTTIYDAVEWSKTGRGGTTYDMIRMTIDADACSSRYNLCE